MKKKIRLFTAFAMAVVMAAFVFLTSCGNGSQTGTESGNTDDTEVFDYSENDLTEYYKLASVDILSKDSIKAYIESVADKSAVTADGEKVTLADGYTLEAEYVLRGGDGQKVLESGNIVFTLGEEEPFSGMYDALLSSVVTIGAERIVRTVAVPEKYPDEETVSLSLTVKRVTPPFVSSGDYDTQLAYYRASLLLEYNKSLSAEGAAIANGDKVITSYKLVSRAENAGYKVGDVLDSGDSFTFTVGSGSTLADFDAAFIGHSAGDSFTNDMTLPEDYGNENMHGLDVTFECTVKKVIKTLNENTVKAMGYESLDDFNKKTDARSRASYTVMSAAFGLLKQNSELISLPGSAIYTYKDENTYYRYYYLKYLAYYYSMMGSTATVDDIAKALYGFDTAQDYVVSYFNSDELDAQAKAAVEEELFLYSFIKATGLDVSDSKFADTKAEDTAQILGYAGTEELYKAYSSFYDVSASRALMLLKAKYYGIAAEEYLYGLFG